MIDRRNFIARSAGLAALPSMGALVSAAARAQPLAGNTSVVSGFPAGGMGDMVARPLIDKLRGKYADVLLLESRTGAGGRIAAEYVKRAAPDGKTVLQIPGSVMSLYPHIYAKLPYDPVADFIPISPLCSYVYSFTAGPGLPAEIKTVEEYVKWAKANPKQAVYGIPAAGSALHFAGMMLQRSARMEFTSVPYRGGAPLLQDLLGGQVPVSFNVLGEVLPSVKTGKLRSLAVTSAKRSQFMPETPTMIEQGYPDIALQEWLGWFVPAKTPDDIVRRLNAQVRDGLSAPDLQETLARNALESLYQTPEEFAATLKRDIAYWAPIVKATGFKADE
ncbi:tripartite tricarboxylate transporter substrate binding protein [soil metagenome]